MSNGCLCSSFRRNYGKLSNSMVDLVTVKLDTYVWWLSELDIHLNSQVAIISNWLFKYHSFWRCKFDSHQIQIVSLNYTHRSSYILVGYTWARHFDTSTSSEIHILDNTIFNSQNLQLNDENHFVAFPMKAKLKDVQCRLCQQAN